MSVLVVPYYNSLIDKLRNARRQSCIPLTPTYHTITNGKACNELWLRFRGHVSHGT